MHKLVEYETLKRTFSTSQTTDSTRVVSTSPRGRGRTLHTHTHTPWSPQSLNGSAPAHPATSISKWLSASLRQHHRDSARAILRRVRLAATRDARDQMTGTGVGRPRDERTDHHDDDWTSSLEQSSGVHLSSFSSWCHQSFLVSDPVGRVDCCHNSCPPRRKTPLHVNLTLQSRICRANSTPGTRFSTCPSTQGGRHPEGSLGDGIANSRFSEHRYVRSCREAGGASLNVQLMVTDVQNIGPSAPRW